MFDFSMLSYDQIYFSLLQDDYIPYPRIEDVSPWTHTHTHTHTRQTNTSKHTTVQIKH